MVIITKRLINPLIVLLASLLFMLLVSKIPALTLTTTRYGDNFLPIVALIFVVTTLVGSQLNLKFVIPILLVAVFISPLTNITDSGWYNIPSSGLLFGTLFQIRPLQIKLRKGHWYLFGAVLSLGLYYNLIPALFGDNDGFNNKLWLYNFSTFIRYIYIALLFIQVKPNRTKLFYYVNWFALGFALLVILEAIHIPSINIAMKTISQIGYRPLEISHDIALNYFRASGIAIDANHAATRLAILLPIILIQFRTFKYSLAVVAIVLVGVYLTGSRAGVVLSLAAISLWFVYGGRWTEKYRFIFKAGVIAGLILLAGLLNPSMFRVTEIATTRYLIFIDVEKQTTDKSFVFRQTELIQAVKNITPFGDRTDHLATVHSELGRLFRFYGIFGILVTSLFWGFFYYLVRKNYPAATLVALMFLNSFWKWTFHIEAFFIPTILVAVMYLNKYNEPQEDKN